MITAKNYHIASKGTFNVVSTSKIKRLWFALQKQGFDITETPTGTEYQFESKTYRFDYFSISEKYVSMSIYFIVDGKQLLRISDHWSNGSKNLITKKVGNIRSCVWNIQGNSFPFYLRIQGNVIRERVQHLSMWGNHYYTTEYREITNCLLAGIININELKPVK